MTFWHKTSLSCYLGVIFFGLLTYWMPDAINAVIAFCVWGIVSTVCWIREETK